MAVLSDIQKRYIDLYERAYRSNHYTFTGFLNEAEYADLLLLKNEIPANSFSAFGGYPSATRVMVRFGNPQELGYTEEFPLTILKIEPISKKFAEELTHRDFLGALMNLGIQRTELGDILVSDKSACLICSRKMADYVSDNLTRIKRTVVSVCETRKLPTDVTPRRETVQVQISSERMDVFVAKVCKLSRKECAEHFAEKKVFLNGRLMENHSKQLANGDVISIRGFGKFHYCGIHKTTQKGNLIVSYEHYI